MSERTGETPELISRAVRCWVGLDVPGRPNVVPVSPEVCPYLKAFYSSVVFLLKPLGTDKPLSMLGKQCPQCKQTFLGCLADDPKPTCWCVGFPAFLPPDPDKSCMCPRCLAETLHGQIEQLIKDDGLDAVLEKAKPFRNLAQLVEHLDYSIEDGNYVFSKWYHLKRGSCCGSGCRNCPYPTR